MTIKPDDLAYWFFRINGCLNIVNFLVHHEQRGREGTDVDILAARFPFRQELAISGNPMEDHVCFQSGGKIDLIIAEVKRGLCDLNGPWTDRERENMQRVLYALGSFHGDLIDIVAGNLYEYQYHEDESYRVRLFAFGEKINESLSENVVQITWNEALYFIYQRFRKYSSEKSQHRQWSSTGRLLFNRSQSINSVDEFISTFLNLLE